MKNVSALALVALSSLLWHGLAPAQDAAMPLVREYRGVPYVTGGVGEAERAALLATASDFNLKLTFAAKGGAYLAGVAVRIHDGTDATVLELTSDGPLVLARLPAAEYRVSVTAAEGREQVRSVSVPATGQRSIVFYW